MPKFSAFSRRKSTADEVQNALINPTEQQPSFRVIERTDVSSGKSFDGGARLARASGTHLTKPNHLDFDHDDNMFAHLKGDRGSGGSNFTKASSADASSRHSNASTAPSSADMAMTAAPHDETRTPSKKSIQDSPARRGVSSSGSGFLSKAGRTFSFGSRKANAPSPTDDVVPDVPPIPKIQREDENGRSRGLTNSTTSTTIAPILEGEGMDLGGDFGTMFKGSGFDKRASMATLTNNHPLPQVPEATGRHGQPGNLTLDTTSSIDPGPLSLNSQNSHDNLLPSKSPNLAYDRSPPVPRHQLSFESRPVASEPVDEDVMLLQDTMAATRFLSGSSDAPRPSHPGRYRSEEESFTVIPRKPSETIATSQDNIFAGTSSRISRLPQSQAPRPASSAPQNKVMTPAEFERYRRHKEQLGTTPDGKAPAATEEDDDDDEINYDDEEDEIAKSKEQAKQRRKQEAHMAVYRQQMRKVVGESSPLPPSPSGRPNLPTSLSAPQLSIMKSPSPDSAVTDEDEDEEVPLAILQAHGFPHKHRSPTNLPSMGSSPNLRTTSQASHRPGSSLGEPAPSNNDRQRHSTLPAFARHLPQDPFVGASVSRPAIRESLAFGGGNPAPAQAPGVLPPGGLVGVIASEERSRAMRRGSPNMESQKFTPAGQMGVDPMAGIPPQMMYGQQGMPGMPGMPMMPPQMLTPGDQAQIQMTQQMQQFMQMQMQFMQMMAGGQGGQQQMPMQAPYMAQGASHSQADLSGRQSVMGDFMPEPPRFNAGMRTMSMVQPNTGSFGQQTGYAPSFHSPSPGYTPSIAPSERSNVGLPGRYRPVSQAPASIHSRGHSRSNTMSGALSQFGGDASKPTINVVSHATHGSDDDDEEGWEAMKAKRDKKRSMWKTKKEFGGVLDAIH